MSLDYYAILDVPRTATIYEIKLAYRKLAIRLHPHRHQYPQHPNPQPEGTFNLPLPSLPENIYWELLNEAYDVLSNDLRREIFDNFGKEGLARGVAAPTGYIQPYSYHGDYMRTYFEFFGTYSPYADLIDATTNPPMLYKVNEGVGVRHKDPPIEKFLNLNLEEIFHGGSKLVKILRHEFVDDFQTKTEVQEDVLTVPIVPGILEGTRIVFPEAGDQGPTRIPSDIIFVVKGNPHEVYRRDNCDLHMDHKISLKEALTGFKITINTIDGRKLDVMVTDVVGCNQTFKVPNEGLPNLYDNRQKGDLIIHFEIVFPPYIEKKFREKLADIFDEIEESLEDKDYSCQCKMGPSASLNPNHSKK